MRSLRNGDEGTVWLKSSRKMEEQKEKQDLQERQEQ